MQPDFPVVPSPFQGGSPGQRPSSTDSKAVVAFVLGLFAILGTFCGLGLLFGLPAMVFGAVALRDIGRAAGALLGRGLATSGAILGAVGSVLFFGWASLVAFLLITPQMATLALPSPANDAPTSAWSTTVPFAPSNEVASAHGVALHPAGGALRIQLAKQASSAHNAGETVLVEATAPDCDACDEIGLALREPELQSALLKVRLVQVDTGEFHPELGRLRMDESTAPWFYLIDSRGEPRDAIGADEWDDNDAKNIAPVLHAFVHGKLRPRRHEWHGGATL